MTQFIKEGDVESALHYLMNNSAEAAQSRANRLYVEEYLKVIKATIMKENAELPLGAQEREAYADKRYADHLQAIREATYADEKARFDLRAAETLCEAWRSQCANERAVNL